MKRHTPEQIVRKLRQADAELAAGASVPEVARRLDISEATFHRWRNHYGGMKADAMKRLKQLEAENARLKKIVADQAVDIDILKEVSRETSKIKTRRRAAVEHVRRHLGVSERRACRVISQPRSSQRQEGQKIGRDRALLERMVTLSRENPILSAWGQNEPYENHFIFNPYGHGWHLDRRRFDAMLAQAAEEAGANVFQAAQVSACLPVASRGWQVGFASDGQHNCLRASFLVYATGRVGLAARRLGAKRIFYDRLVGLVGFFSASSAGTRYDYQTLVEATENGWWYSARLPDSRLVVAYMTDADLLPKGGMPVSEYWQDRLERAPNTRTRTSGWVPEAGIRSVAANSYRMDPVTGNNWLVAGDAAIAFDPLSSQGIYRALKSGLLAARTIENCLLGDQTALKEYARGIQRSFDKYLSMRAITYGRERRWTSSAFWQRRHNESDHAQ